MSTDVTHGGADSDQQLWGMGQEMNTGMLMLRSSPGGMAVCQSWVERMQQEMVSIARLPANMLQWWSNDQTFFNEIVHRGTIVSALKDPKPESRAAAAEQLRLSMRTPARRAALATALEKLQVHSPAEGLSPAARCTRACSPGPQSPQPWACRLQPHVPVRR